MGSVTVPICSSRGLGFGGISYMYKKLSSWYSFTAILLTVSVCCLLFAYKTRIIKPTENFKLGVFATGGIFLVYIASLIMSFLVLNANMDPSTASLLSIGFSLFVAVMLH